MTITINEPTVETQLRTEAAKRGLVPGEYALRLLALHLPPKPFGSPQEIVASADWSQKFNTWVNAHSRRSALPDESFSRASFYGEPN